MKCSISSHFPLICIVNSSIVKHTLKANNRALARALEACRQELGERDRALGERDRTILSLQEQQQTLQRVAGLRDSQISQEVDLRIQVRITWLKDSCSDVPGGIRCTVAVC